MAHLNIMAKSDSCQSTHALRCQTLAAITRESSKGQRQKVANRQMLSLSWTTNTKSVAMESLSGPMVTLSKASGSTVKHVAWESSEPANTWVVRPMKASGNRIAKPISVCSART